MQMEFLCIKLNQHEHAGSDYSESVNFHKRDATRLHAEKYQTSKQLNCFQIVETLLTVHSKIQLTLVILTSLISNNRLSRSENLVPA